VTDAPAVALSADAVLALLAVAARPTLFGNLGRAVPLPGARAGRALGELKRAGLVTAGGGTSAGCRAADRVTVTALGADRAQAERHRRADDDARGQLSGIARRALDALDRGARPVAVTTVAQRIGCPLTSAESGVRKLVAADLAKVTDTEGGSRVQLTARGRALVRPCVG
jgi:DNA-binding IclR family transcriptional regulator